MSEAAPSTAPVEDSQARIAAAEAAAEAYRREREAMTPDFSEQLNRMDQHLSDAERVQREGHNVPHPPTAEEVQALGPNTRGALREGAADIRRTEREQAYREEIQRLIDDPRDLGANGDWAAADRLARERADQRMRERVRETSQLAAEIGFEQDIKHGRTESATQKLELALKEAVDNNDRESWDRFGRSWNKMFAGSQGSIERLDTLLQDAQQSDDPEAWHEFERAQATLTPRQREIYGRYAAQNGLLLEPEATPEAPVQIPEPTSAPSTPSARADETGTEPLAAPAAHPHRGPDISGSKLADLQVAAEAARNGEPGAQADLDNLLGGLTPDELRVWEASQPDPDQSQPQPRRRPQPRPQRPTEASQPAWEEDPEPSDDDPFFTEPDDSPYIYNPDDTEPDPGDPKRWGDDDYLYDDPEGYANPEDDDPEGYDDFDAMMSRGESNPEKGRRGFWRRLGGVATKLSGVVHTLLEESRNQRDAVYRGDYVMGPVVTGRWRNEDRPAHLVLPAIEDLPHEDALQAQAAFEEAAENAARNAEEARERQREERQQLIEERKKIDTGRFAPWRRRRAARKRRAYNRAKLKTTV